MKSVLITNPGGEVLGRTSLKRARRMVWRGVAHTTAYFTEDGYYGMGEPRVIELNKYIFAKWMYDGKRHKVFSKKGVLRRDNWLCAYCSSKATTIDHIVPRAAGGLSTWLNCVAACQPCNSRKSHKTLEEAGMKLLSPPFEP